MVNMKCLEKVESDVYFGQVVDFLVGMLQRVIIG